MRVIIGSFLVIALVYALISLWQVSRKKREFEAFIAEYKAVTEHREAQWQKIMEGLDK